ncbi:hypothetical protein Tco_0844055 [Tanacetum coccineum]
MPTLSPSPPNVSGSPPLSRWPPQPATFPATFSGEPKNCREDRSAPDLSEPHHHTLSRASITTTHLSRPAMLPYTTSTTPRTITPLPSSSPSQPPPSNSRHPPQPPFAHHPHHNLTMTTPPLSPIEKGVFGRYCHPRLRLAFVVTPRGSVG